MNLGKLKMFTGASYLYMAILIYKVGFFPVSGMCFGMLCTISPFISKTCCENYNRCCPEFQEWLMPLLTMPEGPPGGQYLGQVGGPGGFGFGGPPRSPLRRNYLMDATQYPIMLAQSSSQQASQIVPSVGGQSQANSGQPWPSAAGTFANNNNNKKQPPPVVGAEGVSTSDKKQSQLTSA